jgi:hypothetical protein
MKKADTFDFMHKAHIGVSMKDFEFLLMAMGIEEEFGGMINVDLLRQKVLIYGRKNKIEGCEYF